MTTRQALAALAITATVVGHPGCRRPPQRPNLVLITIDTLRRDHLGCYGYGRPTSPALDRLAADGVRFKHAYAAAPITAPSHASLLTGRHPIHHGVRTNAIYVLEESETTLAEVLAAAGYQTAAFVGAVPLDRVFGFSQGFAEFDDDFSQSVLRGQYRVPWYRIPLDERERRADEVIGPAIGWLESHAEGPFFLWVHLFDPHHPYLPPPPFDQMFEPQSTATDPTITQLVAQGAPWHQWLSGLGSVERVIAQYDGEIAFTDSQVGRLIDALDRVGRRDDTVVAVTADHGEGLGEHGEYFFHGDLVYESTLRVPLLVRAPWRFAAGTHSATRVRGVDLMPTLLELLGVPPPAAIDGESVVGAVGRGDDEIRPVLSEAAYRDRSGRARFAYYEGNSKLIVNDRTAIDAATTECYDIGQDPRETRDLCNTRRDDFSEIRSRFEGLRRGLESSHGAPTTVVPQDVIEALRSLGYQGQ